ncbi:MAG: class I SAM-dependent methyltransferase [Thermoplasmata archaeon]
MEKSPYKAHWERVWTEKGQREVSWFQERPEVSLRLLERVGTDPSSSLIDVGGGASLLVDHLVARAFQRVVVADISERSLARAKARLGEQANTVTWLEADVTTDDLGGPYDVWHDRALFHFLVKSSDQEAYQRQLRSALRPGGRAIVATFGRDGPAKCSGLPVSRYGPRELAAALGDRMVLEHQERELHRTPWGTEQAFIWGLLRRR